VTETNSTTQVSTTSPQEILNALNDGEGNSNLKVNFSWTKNDMRAMIDVLIYKALQSKEKKFFSTVTVPTKNNKQTETPFYDCQMCKVHFPHCNKPAESKKKTLKRVF
jgi:hypothetical protein